MAIRNLDVSGNVTTVRPCAPALSLVELGKKLLLSAKEGDTEQVRLLMSKGAPFTTDWVSSQVVASLRSNSSRSNIGENVVQLSPDA